QQFDPAQFIYPNADTEANLMIANYARHFTLFNRASSFSVAIAGGSVDVNVDTSLVPPGYLPPGVLPGNVFSQSASGYADPTVQLDVNLFGTSPLKSTVDLVNYEPTWTLDAAVMLALPVGKYDSDKLVNMGQNRLFGRIAFPFKYHFGVFAPGYMTSLEIIPSVWLFAENDPLWQLEAHLTHDFTRNFFGSLDLLYRGGFQSEIDGVVAGEELNIGNLGFTLNYQVTDK
ncbi:transporter, partial [Thermodesulfobacteriota bacterium]